MWNISMMKMPLVNHLQLTFVKNWPNQFADLRIIWLYILKYRTLLSANLTKITSWLFTTQARPWIFCWPCNVLKNNLTEKSEESHLPSRKQNMTIARMIAMIMTMMRGTINIKMKSFPKSLAEESYTGATYVDSPKPSPLKTGLVALLETAAVLLLSICKPEHIYGFKNVCTFLLPVTGHVMWLSGNWHRVWRHDIT